MILAQEKVDNPDFANWSKFKKGTSVTRTWTTVDPNGRTRVVTQTQTLEEITSDKIKLEVEYITDIPGSPKLKYSPKPEEIPITVPLPAGMKKEDFAKALPGTVEKGEKAETIKVAGGEFKAVWFKTKVEAGGKEIESKTWVSEDVPGRIVKVEEAKRAKGVLLFTTIREVIDVRKP